MNSQRQASKQELRIKEAFGEGILPRRRKSAVLSLIKPFLGQTLVERADKNR